jgi:hypothetical protein
VTTYISAAVPNSTIIFEIASKELPPNAVKRFTVSYGKRLEQQKGPACCVRIQVILTAYIVNQVMAPYHFSKDPTFTRFDVVVLSQDDLDCPFLLFVLGNRLPINEQNPIEIAARSYFLPCHGTEHNEARIGHIADTEKIVEVIALRVGIAACLTNRGPERAKMRLKLICSGATVGHEV